MLVMTRRIGERIMIAGGIIVEVLDVQRGKVKLGFTAPPEVVIRREENLGGPFGSGEPAPTSAKPA